MEAELPQMLIPAGMVGYLKHFQPFLEARGWLHGCDAAPLLSLAIGCPQVPKGRRCGGTWHQPRGTAVQMESDSHW